MTTTIISRPARQFLTRQRKLQRLEQYAEQRVRLPARRLQQLATPAEATR